MINERNSFFDDYNGFETSRSRVSYSNTPKRRSTQKKKLPSIKFGLLRSLFFTVRTLVFVIIFLFSLGCFFAAGCIKGILDNTPPITSFHLGPTSYSTKILDREGNLYETLIKEGSNREPVKFSDLPENLINAFVAIEDERFWEHSGVDIKSIIRAIVGVLSSDSSLGGGSTITQQLIKNSIFNGAQKEKGFDKYVRKIQEQYIALLYESQDDMSKKEIKESILTDYLNIINLGANTLGIKTAARRYFDKEVSELTLNECAVIAGITKNPTRYNPITKPEENDKRRRTVLKNMLNQGYITRDEYNQCLSEDIYSRIKNINTQLSYSNNVPYSYFTDALIDEVLEYLTSRLGYSESLAKNTLYSGGLTIHSTVDIDLQSIVDEQVNNEDNYSAAKYSATWRYSIRHADGKDEHFNEHHLQKYVASQLSSKKFSGLFLSKDSANRYINQYKQKITSESDIVLGETLNLVLQPQASFVLMDHKTGEVLALSGGRGEKLVSRSLNRATGTHRQPGSTFKVLSAFAPALEEYGKTLASTYYDSEYSFRDKIFKNWYNGGYLGFQNIRAGIVYSLNIVALRCIMETVTPEAGVEFARRLGITTLTENDYNPATALGGLTDGVSNLELTNAFATIANGGKYNDPKLFTKIIDADGRVLVDISTPENKRILSEENAYLLTDAMSDSLKESYAYAGTLRVNSTSTRSSFKGMAIAGKSGTTSSNNDVWFIGYTPFYTAGIWGGCDENQKLNGEDEESTSDDNGGTKFHKNIWRKIMSEIHKSIKNAPFPKPDGIVDVEVCKKSGLLPSSGCHIDLRGDCVYTEHFVKGTEPKQVCGLHNNLGLINIPSTYYGLVTDDLYFSSNMTNVVIPDIPIVDENEDNATIYSSPNVVLTTSPR